MPGRTQSLRAATGPNAWILRKLAKLVGVYASLALPGMLQPVAGAFGVTLVSNTNYVISAVKYASPAECFSLVRRRGFSSLLKFSPGVNLLLSEKLACVCTLL
jgi:hypothetical protein